MSNGFNFKQMMAAKRAGEPEAAAPTVESKAEAIADTPAPAAPAPKVNAFAAKFGAAKPATLTAEPAVEQPKARVQFGKVAVATLDDLANTEEEGIESDEPDYEVREVVSQFDDETPATKPTRELPPEADKNLKQFVDMIDGVYDVVHDPELLGNVIRGIMIELKANPQYMQQVADDDIRVWVRGMRSTMGLARIRKTEAKAKRASGGAKKGKGADAAMEEAFGELGIDLDNL